VYYDGVMPRNTREGGDAIATVPDPEGRTIPQAPVGADQQPSDLGESEDGGGRYRQRGVLGRGGMGEVQLCHDRRIGREVAMKVMPAAPPPPPVARQRFVREARVQGQLEHPAIVPVYDIGRSPEGQLFFTMKRVRGTSLDAIIAGLRRGDPAIVQQHSRRKLLTAFSQVCLAVDFAHSRGVIHRDLKPANVMLGSFGEVYVLDWGVARAQSDDADPPPASTASELAGPGDVRRTATGAMLGTPGYMAPEQIRGEASVASDVYSLGAILFEILALEPLVSGSARQALAATVEGVDARPSARAPDRDVPPELEVVCVRAATVDPSARWRSARELAEAVDRYLDGDRDLERRQQLAQEHADAAMRAADVALSKDGGSDQRRSALREVGRALAFDPEHQGALRTLARLLTEPPREVPPEARAAIIERRLATRRLGARAGFNAYLAWLAVGPVVVWLGVRDLASFLTLLALIIAGAVNMLLMSRWPSERRGGTDVRVMFSLTAGTIAALLVGRMFSPFMAAPALLVGHAMVFVINPGRLWPPLVLAALGMIVLVGLELLGVVSPTFVFEAGTLRILPNMVNIRPVPALIFLMVAYLGCLIVPIVAVGRTVFALEQAERRLNLHAWQLGQLVSPSGSASKKAS
jgi:serine/threonine-protein kinase